MREQIELLNACREVSAATRHLAAESELAELRLDLERLAGRGAGGDDAKGDGRQVGAKGLYSREVAMPRPPSKITSELSERTAGRGSEALIDVVVELEGASGDEPSADALRKAFKQTATPVVEKITNLGGEVTGEAWINQTLRARLPASSVRLLSDLDEVTAVDVPHRLAFD